MRVIASTTLSILLFGSLPAGTPPPWKRLLDGKRWMTRNADVNIKQSYCYEDAEQNCRIYGRLYTWESAQHVCGSFGKTWRLPADEEWRLMAKHYGGVSQDADDKGKAAYAALLDGGGSGFSALLGGGRSDDGKYERLQAHDSIGRPSRSIRLVGGLTTSDEAAKLSIGKLVAKKEERFPSAVSATDGSEEKAWHHPHPDSPIRTATSYACSMTLVGKRSKILLLACCVLCILSEGDRDYE